jgi:outer membrane protein TolC
VDLARRLVTRANASAELTRLEVGVKTADAFLRLATAQETVRAARANVERQQVFSNAVATLVRNQLRPGADDSRAQAEMALARIQLIQAEQAERRLSIQVARFSRSWADRIFLESMSRQPIPSVGPVRRRAARI